MNWLMLRGEYDKNNKYNTSNHLDVWIDLFEGLVGNDKGIVWFKSDKNRKFPYSKNVCIITGGLPKYAYNVDYVFARGGFDYYRKILKKCRKAFKIYYGSGSRYKPVGHIGYNLILLDSSKQLKSIGKGLKAISRLWIKPSLPLFKPMNIKTKYDIAYVAAIPEDKRKNCAWVYKHLPKKCRVLQLGHYPKKLKVPRNVTIKHITKDKMPKAISKCRVAIIPYLEGDSAPRIISEALRCHIPIIVLNKTHFWKEKYLPSLKYGCVCDKRNFWGYVENYLENRLSPEHPYWCDLDNQLSMDVAVKHLRELIFENK